MQITDELIQTVADFKQELYNRLDKIRQLEQTRKEVVNYFGRARIMDGVFARFSPGREELKNLSDNDLTIQKVDNGYRIEWMIIDGDSYDTIFMTLPALFITDFERYYNQVKTEIEDNNKAAEAEYRVWEKNNSEILDKEKETELDRDNIYFSIKEQDDGNFKMNWCSYDTLDGYGDEEAIVPSDFINNFDEYYNKIKDEIEANNEIEKVKFAEYQAKQKLEALEAKQKEIEKMEAKLQADKAKIDKLRKNLSNSGIEL